MEFKKSKTVDITNSPPVILTTSQSTTGSGIGIMISESVTPDKEKSYTHAIDRHRSPLSDSLASSGVSFSCSVCLVCQRVSFGLFFCKNLEQVLTPFQSPRFTTVHNSNKIGDVLAESGVSKILKPFRSFVQKNNRTGPACNIDCVDFFCMLSLTSV